MKEKGVNKFPRQLNHNLELLNMGYAHVNTKWHGNAVHSQYSRLYFIKSGAFFIVNNEGVRTDFKKGGVYLIPSGYTYTYGCEEENEHYFFHIRLYGFDNIDLLGRFNKPIFCDIKTDLDRLSKMIDIGSITASLVIKSEIYRALSEIAVNSDGLLDTANYSNDINSAISYISDNLTAKLSVSEIANAVNLATSTLSAKFRREVGMGVGEYVDYRVILSAAKMLLSTKSFILEISDALGFCDQFYFSRRFKARYGVSPQKFRNEKKRL